MLNDNKANSSQGYPQKWWITSYLKGSIC